VISKLVKNHGLELSGYCRGGMFPAADAAGIAAADLDNRKAVDEACELNAKCLVLVVGGLACSTSAGKAAHKDIALSRTQVHDGIAKLLAYAKVCGMPLAIEPLHPMYAADRACINTMEQALDVCDALDPDRTGALVLPFDVYHVWWDPKLQSQIQRAGQKRLLAFHVCDWLTPTTDLLNDRGMMGDGVIDIPKIRAWVEAEGFNGFSEVEIFSTGNWWQQEPLQSFRHLYRTLQDSSLVVAELALNPRVHQLHTHPQNPMGQRNPGRRHSTRVPAGVLSWLCFAHRR
jgi:sugar phosphate isomerase/epimerase